MKKALLVFVNLMIVGSWLVGQSLRFEHTSYDFGQIYEQNGPASHQFKFKNIGNQPITISRVNASCGCTTPDWSKAPIPPGGEGFIKAEYNPSGRPGPFEKYLQVMLEGSNENAELMIKGEVLPGTGRVRPQPFVFVRNFNYNKYDIARQEQDFQYFIDKVADLMTNFGGATITIESSASKVPTKSFSNNEQLAESRAKEAEMKIFEMLKRKGITNNNLKIMPHKTLVQGPEYKNDFIENRAVYEKYQYVKITVE